MPAQNQNQSQGSSAAAGLTFGAPVDTDTPLKAFQSQETPKQPVPAGPTPSGPSGLTFGAPVEDDTHAADIKDHASSVPQDPTPEEYTAMSPADRAAYESRENRSILDPVTGFVKGAGQTLNTVSGLISSVAPKLVRPSDVEAMKRIETPSNPMQVIGNVGEGIAEFFLGDEALKAISVAERLGMAAKVAKLAESHPVIAKIIGHGLASVRGGVVTTGQQLAHGATLPEALKTGAEAAALGTGIGTVSEGLGYAAPRSSHIFNPDTGTVVPAEEVAGDVIPHPTAGSTRAAAGSLIQQTAKDVLQSSGEDVARAKQAARLVPISGVPSDEFSQKIKEIADEANKPSLTSIPSDEMGNVRALADEISNKKNLTHDEFESYSKQIGDRISDLTNNQTEQSARRLLTQAKNALNEEYYSQLEAAKPEVSKALRDVKQEYAKLSQRFNEGPAKTLFNTTKPENVIKKIVSGGATESEVNDILDTVRRYDTQHPDGLGGGTSIEEYLRKQTLYNQMQKFGKRFLSDGSVQRLDPQAMISDLDKNPAYREIYGPENFDKIRKSLVSEASRQATRQQVMNTLAKSGKGAAYGLMAAGGLQMLGVPIIPAVQSLWNILTTPK